MTIVIQGQRWEVGFGYTGKTNGVVDDGACNYEKKKITIRSEKRGRSRSLAETIFHEVAHARFPDITEDAITALGEIAGEVFKRCSQDEEKSIENS